MKKVVNYLNVISNNKVEVLKWSNNEKTKNNIGDALNPILFESVFQKKVVNINEVVNLGIVPVYSFIGSVLDNNAVRNLTVIGSGFKSADSKMKVSPKKVIATRGKLTQAKLNKFGEKTFDIFGDPAILTPIFMKCELKIKKYKIGYIPHYIDHNAILFKDEIIHNDILFINVFAEPKQFIEELNQCEVIFSSSLHGVILSHSYGIPATWIKISDKIAGGNFKFDDYYSSLDIKVEPIYVHNDYSIRNLIDKAILPDINNLQSKLLNCLKCLEI